VHPVRLQENLISDRVSLLGQSTLVTVTPDTTVGNAISLMRERRCGCVVVCQGDQLAGIFTERDVLKRVLATGADLNSRIDAFMTENPVTIRPADNVGVVIRRMLDGGDRHLPVVDENGRVLGIVSVKGLIHYFVEYFPATVYNLPPVSGQVQTSREGA
jgi:CBS domain-containing protein